MGPPHPLEEGTCLVRPSAPNQHQGPLGIVTQTTDLSVTLNFEIRS